MSVAGTRCPGILWMHEAQDGLLARVRLPGGRIGARGLQTVAAAAKLGSGIVELTSRAGLQVRGIAPDAVAAVEELLAAGGLLPSPAHDRVRNIIASPLGGRAPGARALIDPLLDALDRGLCADPALAELPERFLFAVDDGRGDVAARASDVLLWAEDPERFSLWLAGEPVLRSLPADAAVAEALAAARAALGAPPARARPATAGGPAAPAPGIALQRGGRFSVTGLAPLGRLDAASLTLLAEHGTPVRLSAARTLSLVDLAAAEADAAALALAGAGLVLDPRSGWSGLSACAGLGACPKALGDVRAAASERARVRDAGAGQEHWSACERRCGLPAGAAIAVTITPEGVELRSGGETHLAAGLDAARARLARSLPVIEC